MFFILVLINTKLTYPISNILKGNWDIEYKKFHILGENYLTNWFSLSFNESKEEGPIFGKIFENEWPQYITELNDTRSSISTFQLELSTIMKGYIHLLEPFDQNLGEFDFFETFPNYLGSTGIFNNSLIFTCNIINLATIHIHLSSNQDQIYDEIILTRIRTNLKDPWYWEYNKWIIGIGFFILTYIFLSYSNQIMSFFNFKSEEKKNDQIKKKKKE